MDEEGQKEVVPPNRPKQSQHPGMVPGILGYQSDEDKSGRTYCGLSRLWFFILLAAIIIIVLAVGLGVGLGIGLKNNSSWVYYIVQRSGFSNDEQAFKIKLRLKLNREH